MVDRLEDLLRQPVEALPPVDLDDIRDRAVRRRRRRHVGTALAAVAAVAGTAVLIPLLPTSSPSQPIVGAADHRSSLTGHGGDVEVTFYRDGEDWCTDLVRPREHARRYCEDGLARLIDGERSPVGDDHLWMTFTNTAVRTLSRDAAQERDGASSAPVPEGPVIGAVNWGFVGSSASAVEIRATPLDKPILAQLIDLPDTALQGFLVVAPTELSAYDVVVSGSDGCLLDGQRVRLEIQEGVWADPLWESDCKSAEP